MNETTGYSTRVPQLRIAVNARCGRACLYCRPSGEGLATGAAVALTQDTVVRVVKAFADLGGVDVKITGGDPALWPPLVETVSAITDLRLVKKIEVISRHPQIGALAPALARAGVSVLNMSIDTLDRQIHKLITGVDDLPDVLNALNRCIATGVKCKVNTVVMADINDSQIVPMAEKLGAYGVSTLKLLDIIKDLDSGEESYSRRLALLDKRLSDLYVPLNKYVEEFRGSAAEIGTAFQGGLGHPMTVMKLQSGLTVVVKDHTRGAWYGSICTSCPHYPCHDALMALRLTADARLQPCLLNADAAVQLDVEEADIGPKLQKMLEIYGTAEFAALLPIT